MRVSPLDAISERSFTILSGLSSGSFQFLGGDENTWKAVDPKLAALSHARNSPPAEETW